MQRRILIPEELAGLPDQLPLGEVAQLSGLSMGTSWCVKWVTQSSSNPQAVHAQVTLALAQVIAEMSTWQADSWLSGFNGAPAGSWHVMPPHAANVFACALAVAEDSGGAFDPTVGTLVNLWGFGPEGACSTPPLPADIARLKAVCGWQRLLVQDGSVQQPGGVYVDLSGIAKGYAVDLVASYLKAMDITNFLVEIGGELYGHGIKPDGQPWWVALENPLSGTEHVQPLVALHGLAVATSGDYRRFFEVDGTRYSHTIDPRTGCCVTQSASAVTVLHASCMQADAYATVLTVLGVKAGMDYATQRGIAAQLTQLEQGIPVQYSTPALLAMQQDDPA